MTGESSVERRETRSGSASSTLSLLNDLLTPSELSTISNDSKILFKAIDKSLAKHLKTITDQYDELLMQKDKEIKDLASRVAALESYNDNLQSKLMTFQNDIDSIDQYERRDSLILSGSVLPNEHSDENPVQVVVDTMKSYLKIPFTAEDINVAHRLGRMKPGQSRPIIVKLISRSKKAQITRARLSLPKATSNASSLYVNESLTPIRRTMFYQMRQVRKKHRAAFKQLDTQDGKIMIKLVATEDRKYGITNMSELHEFLKVSPVLSDTYQELFGTSS